MCQIRDFFVTGISKRSTAYLATALHQMPDNRPLCAEHGVIKIPAKLVCQRPQIQCRIDNSGRQDNVSAVLQRFLNSISAKIDLRADNLVFVIVRDPFIDILDLNILVKQHLHDIGAVVNRGNLAVYALLLGNLGYNICRTDGIHPALIGDNLNTFLHAVLQDGANAILQIRVEQSGVCLPKVVDLGRTHRHFAHGLKADVINISARN